MYDSKTTTMTSKTRRVQNGKPEGASEEMKLSESVGCSVNVTLHLVRQGHVTLNMTSHFSGSNEARTTIFV